MSLSNMFIVPHKYDGEYPVVPANTRVIAQNNTMIRPFDISYNGSPMDQSLVTYYFTGSSSVVDYIDRLPVVSHVDLCVTIDNPTFKIKFPAFVMSVKLTLNADKIQFNSDDHWLIIGIEGDSVQTVFLDVNKPVIVSVLPSNTTTIYLEKSVRRCSLPPFCGEIISYGSSLGLDLSFPGGRLDCQPLFQSDQTVPMPYPRQQTVMHLKYPHGIKCHLREYYKKPSTSKYVCANRRLYEFVQSDRPLDVITTCWVKESGDVLDCLWLVINYCRNLFIGDLGFKRKTYLQKKGFRFSSVSERIVSIGLRRIPRKLKITFVNQSLTRHIQSSYITFTGFGSTNSTSSLTTFKFDSNNVETFFDFDSIEQLSLQKLSINSRQAVRLLTNSIEHTNKIEQLTIKSKNICICKAHRFDTYGHGTHHSRRLEVNNLSELFPHVKYLKWYVKRITRYDLLPSTLVSLKHHGINLCTHRSLPPLLDIMIRPRFQDTIKTINVHCQNIELTHLHRNWERLVKFLYLINTTSLSSLPVTLIWSLAKEYLQYCY
jgi:hypothetical protein